MRDIKLNKKVIIMLFTLSVILLGGGYLWACTRILSNNKFGILVGRNMDWADLDHTAHKIVVLPRGATRNGGTTVNPLEWVSKYGSLVVTMYDIATTEGINEAGFGMSMLFLNGVEFGERDSSRPGLFANIWGQFFLDNFSTVAEAVSYLDNNDMQVVTAHLVGPNMNRSVDLHLSLQDATGDSAIIEYEKGKVAVYHDANHTVMTNDPFFREQLTNLKRYQDKKGDYPLAPLPAMQKKEGFWSKIASAFKKDSPLSIPGYLIPRDRFVRASYYSSIAKEPRTESENRITMLGLLANVAPPLIQQTNPNAGPDASSTTYMTLSDLTNLKLYMSMQHYHSLISVDMKRLDFSVTAPMMMFDVQNIDAHGDVTNDLKPMANPFNFITEESFHQFKMG